jgi:hypothetical protein
MDKHRRLYLPGRKRRKIVVPVKSDRDFACVEALDYLIRLEVWPPPGRQKRALHDTWLGLALFLPSLLFVLWRISRG